MEGLGPRTDVAGRAAEAIFDYWSEEIWRGPYSIDEEQGAETLALLADLVNAL